MGEKWIPQGHEVIQSAVLFDQREIFISEPDQKILRGLALAVAQVANTEIEIQKQARQCKKNALQWVRPLVICFPEISWREILPDDSLQCSGMVARGWELQLRQTLFIAAMESDQCLPQHFEIGYVQSGLDWGIRMQQEGDLEHGSYRWEAPIQMEADLELLQPPIVKVDYEASEALLSLAEATFGDILAVRRKESWFWTTGLTQTFIHLRGLEQMMFDMMDRPDFVHQLMGRLRDGTIAFLEELEAKQLLFPNWDIAYCGSGGVGLTDVLPQMDYEGVVRLKDQWGFSESQETVGVSPRMFQRFIFPYQKPILERFGMTYYGCCEPVDKRWQILKEVQNLRRVSVSPWADRETMARYLGQEYIFCLKPNPAVMAREVLPEDEIREYIRETLAIAGDCHLEIILKDVTTVNNQPERILRWVKIVKEEIIQKYGDA